MAKERRHRVPWAQDEGPGSWLFPDPPTPSGPAKAWFCVRSRMRRRRGRGYPPGGVGRGAALAAPHRRGPVRSQRESTVFGVGCRTRSRSACDRRPQVNQGIPQGPPHPVHQEESGQMSQSARRVRSPQGLLPTSRGKHWSTRTWRAPVEGVLWKGCPRANASPRSARCTKRCGRRGACFRVESPHTLSRRRPSDVVVAAHVVHPAPNRSRQGRTRRARAASGLGRPGGQRLPEERP